MYGDMLIGALTSPSGGGSGGGVASTVTETETL